MTTNTPAPMGSLMKGRKMIESEALWGHTISVSRHVDGRSIKSVSQQSAPEGKAKAETERQLQMAALAPNEGNTPAAAKLVA